MTDFNLFFVFINQGVCHEMKRRKLHCYIDNSFTVLVDTYTQNDWTSSMLWLLIILVRGGYVFIILLLSYRGWEKWHRLLMHLIKTSSSWIDSWEVYKTIKDWCSGEVIHSVVLLISQRYSEDRNNPDAHWYTTKSVGRDQVI